MKIRLFTIAAATIAMTCAFSMTVSLAAKDKKTASTPALSPIDPTLTPEQQSAEKREEKKARKPTTTGDVIPPGYPLTTCVVCGKPLKPGTLYTFSYKRDGKPDQVCVLDDKKCVKEFEKNPDKYLDMVAAAYAAAAKK